MNTQQDNEASNMNAIPAAGVSVGLTLREAREQLGLSINDVSNRIKFAPKQIEWLEADDFVRLPEAAFVRGFVRSYARLLKLNSADLLSGLPSVYLQTSSAHEIKSVDIPMPNSFTARRHNIIWLAAALAIAVTLAIFERMHDPVPEKTEIESVTSTVQTQELQLPNETTGNVSDQKAEQVLPSVTVTQRAIEVNKVPAPQQAVRLTPAPVLQQQVVRVTPTPAPVQAALPSTPATMPVTAVPKQPKPDHSAQLLMPWLPYAQQTKRAAPAPADTSAAAPTSEAQPKPTTNTTTNTNTNTNTVASGPDHALRIEFDEDAWLEIKDANEKVLVSRMHTAGSLVRVTGKAPLLVVIGNARAVRLFDNGKKINLERYINGDVARVTLQ